MLIGQIEILLNCSSNPLTPDMCKPGWRTSDVLFSYLHVYYVIGHGKGFGLKIGGSHSWRATPIVGENEYLGRVGFRRWPHMLTHYPGRWELRDYIGRTRPTDGGENRSKERIVKPCLMDTEKPHFSVHSCAVLHACQGSMDFCQKNVKIILRVWTYQSIAWEQHSKLVSLGFQSICLGSK